MSQQIRVLQCINCDIYQVDIVKKIPKWQCKICCQQQAVFEEFFRGTGAECRARVQQLNLERGQRRKEQEEAIIGDLQQRKEANQLIESPLKPQTANKLTESPSKIERKSKWASFIDEPNPKDGQLEDLPKSPLGITNYVKTQSKKRKGESNDFVASRKTPSKWKDFL